MDNSGSMTEKVAGTTTSATEIHTLTVPISSGNDDAEEKTSGNKKTKTGSSDLEMSTDGSTVQLVGLRFQDVDIPEDATIESAYIQFEADDDSGQPGTGTTTLDIQIQSHDNPPTFINEQPQNIEDRSLYSTNVPWNPPAWNSVNERGDKQKTPDLKSLVQLVVDRGGWSEGNSIVFVITGTGKRSAQSYNHDSGSGAAELIIEYSTDGEEEKTRMQVMQDALRTVLTNAPDNLSVGIMNYGDVTGWRKNYPNGVKFPITAVSSLARPIVEESMMLDGTVRWDYSNIPEPSDTVTVRTFLSEIADDWEPRGMTPIVDALYEASQYFRGEEVDYGYDYARKTKKWAAHPSTYIGEPVNQKTDSGSCSETPSRYRVWNDSIDQWRDGETWGRVCPADRSNPSGPGLASNCAGTEYNCTTSSYWGCRSSWVGGVTTCTGTDEDGNPTGCSTTGATCEDNDYGNVTNKYCDYAICKDAALPKPKYESPMQDGCQSSFMILMSDGKPEYSNGVNTDPKSYGRVKSLLNKSSCDITHGFRSGRCGEDLTHYLATHDNQPNVNGDQFLHTYVIGFSEGITPEASDYLQSLVTLEDDPETAKKEGYFSATNEAELADAFSQALDEIAEEARSQASPGYSVNVKSGLEHEDDIYIPVFDKSSSSRWAGNLKKFKLDDVDGDRVIKGKDGSGGLTSAMTELGLFKDEAWDIWSTSQIPDGDVVQHGGTASLLNDPRERNIYTNVFSNNLSSTQNYLRKQNNKITSDMLFDSDALGLSTQEAKDYRKKLLSFMRGWVGGDDGGWGDGIGNGFPEGNIPAQTRKHMGDMLHTEPVIVTYKKSTDNAAKEQYIFAATNEGYLHAFDSTSGEEVFAFMPKELFKIIEPQFTGQGPHNYGIDGNISYWHNDENKDGNVNGSDHVYLYFGLRRGGKSYYALDVTNINSPMLLWKIDGNDSQFSHMGQSWSMPYLANVLVGSGTNATKKEAVIIAGGNDSVLDYNEDYDPADVLVTKTPTMGNDIYIVDAKTGQKLWSMRETVGATVTQAFPGGARILDVNKNDILDRMYFADTGGSVWRLDFLTESLSGSADDFKLTKLADLGTAGSSAARKFYNEPDVASFRSNGKTMFTVSVGSGIRPHPMNEKIDDHMFVILDKSPLKELDDDFTSIQISDLAQVEIDVVGGGTTVTKSITQDSDFDGKQITQTDKLGWYVNFFESGEKVLASAITFEGSISFTTLVPKVLTMGELINSCAAPATQGRIYAMDLLTGEASIDIDGNGVINDNDVFQTISASEIPGTPQRVFNELTCEDGECSHKVDIRIGKKSTEVGTKDVEAIESIYWSDPR